MNQQVVDILLRIDARTAALNGVQRSVKQLENSFSSLGRVAATFAGVNISLHGMLAGVRTLSVGAFQLAEKVSDLAQRFKTTTDAIQVVDYQARRFGLTIDDTAGFADRLQAKLEEARAGNLTTAKSFADMRLSVDSLIKLPFERRLEAFGRALAEGAGNSDVYSAAVDIAGTNSQKLFDVLRTLGLEYDKVADRAKAAGQVMSRSAARDLAEAKQDWSDIVQWVKVRGAQVWAIMGDSPADAAIKRIWDNAGDAIDASSPGGTGAAATPAQLEAEQARAFLASEEAKRLRERLATLRDATAGDKERLAVQLERYNVLVAEKALAMTIAQSDEQRQRVELEFEVRILEVEKQIQTTRDAIKAADKSAAADAKREADERSKILALEVKRREIVIDRLQFERDQVAGRGDLSEVEKQRRIQELVVAQRAVIAEIVRLKKEALATATAAERVQLEADIQSLGQQSTVLGKGITPEASTWEKQIQLADRLRGGIESIGMAMSDALFRGGSMREGLSNVFRSIAAEIAAATIKALIFRAIVGMSGGSNVGFAGFLGLDKMGYADGGYASARYTGPGTRYQVAGVVHAGEGVIDKPTLDARGGEPFFRSLLSSLRSPGYASGGYVGELSRSGALAKMRPVVEVHQKFEAGITPDYLNAILPAVKEDTKAGVFDALARREFTL